MARVGIYRFSICKDGTDRPKGYTVCEELSSIGLRAGGARGAAAPPKFRELRFFGQREEIWAKPVFKGRLPVHLIILKT